MSFPRYVDFKDSGVAWLGQIPRHWSLPKIKHIASFTGGGTPSRDNLQFWGGPIPWVSPKDMKVEEICEAEESITALGLSNSSTSLVERGHVLLVVRSGILKHTIPVAVNVVAVALNQDMKAVRFDPQRCTSSFFSRWVQGLNDQLLLAWAKQGATVESIEHGYMAESIIPLPPLGEQAAIDRFLDHETSKIDALVEEQRLLIELLKEKRQAVISQAVTKGLNPSVPMKDSGVEWLGKVPAHWEVMALRRCAKSVETGGTPSAYPPATDLEDGFVWFTPGDFGESLVLSTSARKITQSSVESGDVKIFAAGSVLVVSIGATLGKVGFAPTPSSANQQINAVIPNSRANGCFLAWSLRAKAEVMRFLSNSSTIGIMNQEKTKDIWLALPPISEQVSIAAKLDRLTEELDRLTDEAQAAVELLQERRSALISAAVTGKIDVRGLVPQPETVAA